MSRPAYSTLIMEAVDNPIGEVVGPAPPDGSFWVVRQITVLCDQIPVGSLGGISITDGALAPIFALAPGEAVALHAYHWEGRHVLQPVDSVVVVTSDDHWSWRISGYVLTE